MDGVKSFLCLAFLLALISRGETAEADATPRPRKKSSTAAAATPSVKGKKRAGADDAEDSQPAAKAKAPASPHKKAGAAADEDDAPAKAKTSPGSHKKADDSDDETSVKAKNTPAPGRNKADDHNDGAQIKPKGTLPDDEHKKPSVEPEAAVPNKSGPYPTASIPSSELQGFGESSQETQKLIEDALALAQRNLTYKFGSDDPANGGMDCSGTIAYLFRQHGYPDIPRDASGQYIWVRKEGQFFAVESTKAGGFEFSDLRPGDLMFWSGTYAAGDRDPPVTHTMLYLGVQTSRKRQVMWGASDGRTYDSKQRFGVSVFDFTMPHAETSLARFLGYGHPPARDRPVAKVVAEAEPVPKSTPAPKATPAVKSVSKHKRRD